MIRRHRSALDDAEHRAGAEVEAWRSGRRCVCGPALDAALRGWRELPGGGVLAFEWPSGAAVDPPVSDPRTAGSRARAAGG